MDRSDSFDNDFTNDVNDLFLEVSTYTFNHFGTIHWTLVFVVLEGVLASSTGFTFALEVIKKDTYFTMGPSNVVSRNVGWPMGGSFSEPATLIDLQHCVKVLYQSKKMATTMQMDI